MSSDNYHAAQGLAGRLLEAGYTLAAVTGGDLLPVQLGDVYEEVIRPYVEEHLADELLEQLALDHGLECELRSGSPTERAAYGLQWSWIVVDAGGYPIVHAATPLGAVEKLRRWRLPDRARRHPTRRR